MNKVTHPPGMLLPRLMHSGRVCHFVMKIIRMHGWMLISVMLAVGEDERHGHGEGKDFRGID